MSFNNNLEATKPFCKVCYNAGKPENEYTSHFVRSLPNMISETCILCPLLTSTKDLDERKPAKPKAQKAYKRQNTSIPAVLRMRSEDRSETMKMPRVTRNFEWSETDENDTDYDESYEEEAEKNFYLLNYVYPTEPN